MHLQNMQYFKSDVLDHQIGLALLSETLDLMMFNFGTTERNKQGEKLSLKTHFMQKSVEHHYQFTILTISM